MSKRRDKWILFGTACAFILILLALAVCIPNPTPHQAQTFRIVLAMVAGAFGQAIPGVLAVNLSARGGIWTWGLRATGACAFFVVVYFWNPAALAVGDLPKG